jgi:hypothetical protein
MPLLHDVPEHEHYLIHFRDEFDGSGRKIFRCAREFKRGGCVFSTKDVAIVEAINSSQEQKEM